jgi:hypothetical protein
MFYDQNKPGAARLFGLDIVDWLMLAVAVALIAVIAVLA